MFNTVNWNQWPKKMKVAILRLISVTITTKKGHSKQNYNYISQTCLWKRPCKNTAYLQPAIILWLVTQQSSSTRDCATYFSASWVNWVLLCNWKHIRIFCLTISTSGFEQKGPWLSETGESRSTFQKSFMAQWLSHLNRSPHAHTLNVADGALQVSEFPSIILFFHNYFVLKNGDKSHFAAIENYWHLWQLNIVVGKMMF